MSGIPWDDGYSPVPRAWFRKGGLPPDHPDFGKPMSEREARVDLLILANHDERDGLPRGSCDPALTYLEWRWNWQRGRVRRFLDGLVRDEIIVRDEWSDRGRIVTRFVGFDPPRKATQPATPPEDSKRHSGVQEPQRFSEGPRHPSNAHSDIARDPNRKEPFDWKKEDVRLEGDRTEQRPCSSCGDVAIAWDEDECSRCLSSKRSQQLIDRWTPEGVS